MEAGVAVTETPRGIYVTILGTHGDIVLDVSTTADGERIIRALAIASQVASESLAQPEIWVHERREDGPRPDQESKQVRID